MIAVMDKGPVVVRDVAGLIQVLTGDLHALRLVAIDGVPGAGKSTLRRNLAGPLSASELELDDFLIRNQKEFVAALRTDDLASALASSRGLVIVSGACVLKVLASLQLKPDVFIYVKRMAIWGWADEEEVNGSQIEGSAAITKASSDAAALDLEVRRYHGEFRPHEVADVVFERRDYM